MTDTSITIASADADRTDKQIHRAQAVSLPAGSFDLATLTKSLDEAALAKNDDKRDELIAKAVADANETPLPADTLGVPAGYKRVDAVDEANGIKEQRVVFDPDARDEAEAAQENYQPAVDPAKAADAPAEQKGSN